MPKPNQRFCAAVTAGVAGRHHLRADDPGGVHVEADQPADEQPHLRVRHPAPEVRGPVAARRLTSAEVPVEVAVPELERATA